MLISSFRLQNGTLITPLLLFCLKMSLVCTRTHPFVEYTPSKFLNSFVQSAVGARRQSDENPNSSVVAGTMKRKTSVRAREKFSTKLFFFRDCLTVPKMIHLAHALSLYMTPYLNTIPNALGFYPKLKTLSGANSKTKNTRHRQLYRIEYYVKQKHPRALGWC